MDEPRRITTAELREIVGDAEELAKGTRMFDEGGLQHLARHGNRVFAEARGSATYRVTLTFEPAAVRSRCTCMAARSRPVCKHGAALAVAWARAPESFVVGEAPPPGAEPGIARKKAVRAGKAQAAELMRRGVEQVTALVRELALPGVASVPTGRLEQLRQVAEQLRENRLRRLSARALELAHVLQPADAERVAPLAYADLVADLLLTARKLERHLGGEPLDDRYVEELVGRTWRPADRKPVADLDLVEYAYLVRTTADGYTIRESRFLELAAGGHYSEKQILPGFLARRTAPKRSWASLVLRGAAGGAYPGFPPLRLDLMPATTEALSAADLERVVAVALPDTSTAMRAFQDHRRDPFAPDRMPVAVRASTVVASGARLSVADEAGAAVFLPEGSTLAERVGPRPLRALAGDLEVEGALPVLRPLAAVVESAQGLQLIDAVDPEADSDVLRHWTVTARQAGLSAAAIALAEVREELAVALVAGLAGVGPRVTEPLAARLVDLGLGKQAELLREIATRAEPAARLDDFVRLYQVLGLAVVRLAGACPVDREGLVRVPGLPAVCVPAPAESCDAAEVARRRAQGTMSPWEAAVHRARHFAALPVAELESIFPHWADGAAAPHVAAALRAAPDIARATAERALKLEHGLAAALGAVQVLAAQDDPRAKALLRGAGQGSLLAWFAPTSSRAAREALRQAAGAALGAQPKPAAEAELQAAVESLRGTTRADAREQAARSLAELGLRAALPALRLAWRRDASDKVRNAAAEALACLGDLEMVEPFVDAFTARDRSDALAKGAARALGLLADTRGVAALVAAVLEGWKPAVTVEALRQSGLAALHGLVDLARREPGLAKRQAALSVVAALPAAAVEGFLLAELDRGGAGDAEAAAVVLRLASAHATAERAVAQRILSGTTGDGKADKALRKAAQAALR